MKAFSNESKRIINKAARNNKLVVFVGAGVSMNSGYPSWQELIKDFAEGLGYDMKESSFDELLRIPQYYYNSRKEKEYYDIILNSFDIKAEPNKIHDLILDLNPTHIITTNYDDLIERAANKRGMFYDVVSKDSDLAYSVNNKMIIKMHGDLKNKNIVLKEDDYMSYFNNFKLIQNYIKSLISTHVVLFVGYSVSDVNLKYIFQWVRDILKNNFQQSYLLECSKLLNQLEFEYYKNRGINIVYGKYLISNDSCDENNSGEVEYLEDIGKSTEKMLEYIVKCDTERNLTIDILYEVLEPLEYFNVIRAKDIFLAIQNLNVKNLNIFLENKNLKIDNTCLIELFKSLNKENLGETEKKIINIFDKASFNIIDNNNIIIFKGDKSKNFEDENIYLFNYENIKKTFNDNIYIEVKGREKDALKDAYYLYKINRFVDSYNLLKKISENCIVEKKSYLYFISEINRYFLGKYIIKLKDKSIEQCKVDSIKEELEGMDINNIYSKIPKDSNSIYKELINFDFVNIEIEQVINQVKKIKISKERNLNYIDENDTFKIEELKSELRDFLGFITENMFMYDHFKLVQIVFYEYINGILFYYSKNYNKDLDGVYEEMDYFIIYVIIRYLKYNELKFLFNKYNIKRINIDKGVLKNLNSVNENLFKYLRNSKSKIRLKGMLSRCLFLINNISIEEHENKEIYSNVIDNFIKLLIKNPNLINKNIIDEIINLINKSSYLETLNLSKLLEVLVDLIHKDSEKIKEIEKIELLIANVIDIMKNNELNESDKRNIIKYIELKRNNMDYYYILVTSFDKLDDSNKEHILELINERLNVSKYTLNEFVLYYLIIIRKLLEPNQKFEEKYLECIDDYINKINEKNNKDSNKDSNAVIEHDNTLNILLDTYLLNLFIGNKILNKDSLGRYSQYNKCIKFINEGMKLEDFEAYCINKFPEKINCELAKQIEFKKKIKEYLYKNLDDKETLKTYLKYYV
ncbi:hypothetical protein UT300002_15750 [Clostridium perfringens]